MCVIRYELLSYVLFNCYVKKSCDSIGEKIGACTDAPDSTIWMIGGTEKVANRSDLIVKHHRDTDAGNSSDGGK